MSHSAQDGPPISLFEAEPFSGYGPSRFLPQGEASTGHAIRGRSPAKLRAGVRAHAPKLPGVYSMLDRKDRVIYVGKAKSLRSRLMSYFRVQSREPKAGRILQQTRKLVWEQVPDEFSALLRELELIQRFRPRFNVIGQPGTRRYLYLCIGKSPAPYAFLTRDPTGKELARYGPFVGRDRAEEAVRRMNDWFKLRDCPSTVTMAFSDQPRLFGEEELAAQCLRHEIDNCLGPCGGLCSRKEYGSNVRAARAFLEGRDRTMIRELTKRMTAAAKEQRYEQAIALRDRLQAITWLDDRLRFLRTARMGGSFVYNLAGPEGRTIWYLIHRGEVRAAVRQPETSAELQSANTLCESIFSIRNIEDTHSDLSVDSVLLVMAWFKRNTEEKANLRTREEAMSRMDLSVR